MLSFLFTQTPLRLFVDDIWRDEAFSFLLATRPVHEIISLTAQDFNPPLYYLVLHYWISLFGDTEIALRSLSLIFYILGIFTVYEFIRYVFRQSHKNTICYTLIVFLNPLLTFYAFEARMYSMLFCFAAMSSFFFLTKKRMPYVLVTALGLYTHYFMVLVIAAQGLYILISQEDKRRLVTVIIPGALFFPWVLYFILQNNSLSDSFWISALTYNQVFYMPAYIYTGLVRDYWFSLQDNPDVRAIFQNFNLLFFILILFGIFITRKKTPLFYLFVYVVLQVFVPLVAVVAVDQIQHVFLPRYLITVSLAISLVIVYVLIHLKIHMRLFLAFLVVALSLHFQQLQIESRNKDDLREVIKEIKIEASDEDVIYVTSELDYMVAQYYFDKDKVYIYGKSYDDIPAYVGKVLIPETSIRATYPQYPSQAFVLYEDNTYEIQSSLSQ